MKQHTHTFWLSGWISLLCLAAISPTQAQIVKDATLPVNSAVTSEDNVSTITGGTLADRNLFHSFEQFNINEGQKADFVSPSAAIQNILVRVTGGSRSEIGGMLSTSGLSKPNLFLVNPNGIVFGPNASLDVGGSFVATTANAIEFGDQGFFSASAPNAPGLLTVNPSAFLFNQIATRSIENNSIAPAGVDQSGLELLGLRVPDGRSLLLIGGNVTLDNGQLHALGGRVELGGVVGSGTVGLNIEDNNLRLSYPEIGQRADVSLTNGAVVDVTAAGGGSIAINAQNLDVLKESVLQAGIGEDLESDGTQAGDITLDATGAMTIAGGSSILNQVNYGAVGNAGSILIKAGSLSLTDSAELSANTFNQGEAGGISVQANKFVSIASSSIITGTDEETGVGNAGDINIQTGNLSLTDGGQLDTSTSREGRAGNVIIDARNTVYLENSFISSETYGPGNAGIIDIKARELSLTKGAVLLSATTGEGNASTIEINASDIVSISGVSSEVGFSSGLVTSTEEEDSGQGGDISVTTGALSVSNGAVLSTRTRNASPGGDITVNVNTLNLANGGQLLTTAFNRGRAGNITLKATDSVILSGSDSTYASRLAQFGPDIVDPDSPASGLSARSRGNQAADAGNIKVAARSIRLENQGAIAAETTSGQGGDITLQDLDLLLLRRNSNISTTAGTAGAAGNGGNIDIDADLIVAVSSENSDITANSFVGKGGTIEIRARGIFGLVQRDLEELKTLLGTDDPNELNPTRLRSSDITAISQIDPSFTGQVTINTPDVDPSLGLIALPEEVVDVTGLIAQACSAGGGNVARGASEFIITGRGGLPTNPNEALSSDAIQVDWVTLYPGIENRSSPVVSTNPTAPEPAPIVEAQGWVIGPNKEVVLTATAIPVQPRSSWQPQHECRAR